MPLQIDVQRCVGCGLCVEDCVANCLDLDNGHAVFARNNCIFCGHCTAICPKNAVSLPESRMDLTEAVQTEDLQMDPVNLQKFLSSRRSIRKYQQREIEQEKLEAILETGRMSPTASNRQNLRFVVLRQQLSAFRMLAVESLYKNAKTIADAMGTARYLDKFSKMYQDAQQGADPLFYHAPAVIVVIERGGSVANGAMAASRMELTALAHGLGICYNGFFAIAAEHEPEILKLLGCGPQDQIAMTFSLGYPDVVYQRTAPRKNLRVQWL